MEIIRKKICTDKLLSHRNGIVPYIPKDKDFSGVTYVSTVASESNYGSFPCDFTFIDSHVVFDNETGISYRENNELGRLRYLDVISMYNECNEIVKNGTILKKIHYTEDVNSCDTESGDNGNRLINTGNTNPATQDCYTDCAWIETDEISKFSCRIVDNYFLSESDNGIYTINEDALIRYNDIVTRYGENIDDATDEERKFLENFEYFIGDENDGVLYCSRYIIAVDYYDTYVRNENKWNEWWYENWENCSFNEFYVRWENYVFDLEYHQPVSLKFLYDIEKYVLGRVSVPESYGGREITGTKVPEYVFYLNYMDYVRWFNENEEYLDSNKTIRNEWDKRGGYGLKNFLGSIYPKFFNENISPTNGDVVYFAFSIPNIEIPISLCNEFNNETSYLPYEYSVVDNNIVNGTFAYTSGVSGQIESALTPNFAYFNSSGDGESMAFYGEVNVESKLTDLISNNTYYISDDFYGVFKEFNGGGCLFHCTYYTGTSTGEIIKYTSGCVKYYAKDDNNDWVNIKTIRIPETYVSNVSPDTKPLTQSNAYQVVGIELLYSSSTTSNIQVTDSPTYYNDDGKLKIVSSVTTYNKTIRRTYSWCECEKVLNPSSISCGDGENIDFNGVQKYRNLLILSCVPSASERTNPGDNYYFMAKYDNGYTNIGANKVIDRVCGIKTFGIPYVVGQQMNLESYSDEFSEMKKYDMVVLESVDDNTLTIDYVIGATFGEDIEKTGIHYRDKYPYYGNMFKKVVIDNVYDAEILYENVDLRCKYNAYSEDFDAFRVCTQSEIVAMEIGTQWTNESSVRAYLFTDDTFDNLMEYPKISVDISYNRGNAVAWEKHFKLSECNTFEDLENYGNNYFNL